MSTREGTGRVGRSKAQADGDTTLRRLQARGEQLLQWMPELRKSLLGEGEAGAESLLDQIQSLRGEVSRRAQETGRDLEARAERLLADIERQAVRGLRPLLSRANVATHGEIATLESRVAHLEARLGTLLDDRSQVGSRLGELGRELEETRADSSERLRELTLRLSASDELRSELAGLHEHLAALSKEHVSRSLEIGKVHDRLVRLEMRMGDLLKEHGAQVTDHDEVKRRLAALDQRVEESRRLARDAVNQAAVSAAAARESGHGLEAVRQEGATERAERSEVTRALADLERTLRQIELRVGDMAERQTGMREDLATLAARVSQLELASARPPSAGSVSERAEGH